jgi:hypothetical protein
MCVATRLLTPTHHHRHRVHHHAPPQPGYLWDVPPDPIARCDGLDGVHTLRNTLMSALRALRPSVPFTKAYLDACRTTGVYPPHIDLSRWRPATKKGVTPRTREKGDEEYRATEIQSIAKKVKDIIETQIEHARDYRHVQTGCTRILQLIMQCRSNPHCVEVKKA